METQKEPTDNQNLSPQQRLKGELIGFFAFLLAGTVLALLNAPATLSCERQSREAPSCEIQWNVLFQLVPVRRTPVSPLTDVENRRNEVRSPGDRNTTINYTVVLKTPSDEHRVNLAGEFEPVEATVSEIREFLDDPTQDSLGLSLNPTGGYNWLRWIGDFLMVFGLLYGLSVPIRIWQIATGRS